MAETKWSTPTSEVETILGAGTAPTLKNLTSGSRKLGNEIPNATDRKRFLNLRFMVRGASAFAANSYVTLYAVHSWDGGSNYEDGSDSVTPASHPLDVIPVAAVSTQQTIFRTNIRIAPFDFKLLLVNDTSVGFTNTDNENRLFEYRHGEEQ